MIVNSPYVVCPWCIAPQCRCCAVRCVTICTALHRHWTWSATNIHPYQHMQHARSRMGHLCSHDAHRDQVHSRRPMCRVTRGACMCAKWRSCGARRPMCRITRGAASGCASGATLVTRAALARVRAGALCHCGNDNSIHIHINLLLKLM